MKTVKQNIFNRDNNVFFNLKNEVVKTSNIEEKNYENNKEDKIDKNEEKDKIMKDNDYLANNDNEININNDNNSNRNTYNQNFKENLKNDTVNEYMIELVRKHLGVIKEKEYTIRVSQISEIESNNKNISKSICKIKIENNYETILGIGCLLKFWIHQELYYFLISNEHTIKKDIINNNNIISLYFNGELITSNINNKKI